MGKSLGKSSIGIALSPAAEVSVSPFGEGETIGFRDAQLLKVSDQRELNFLLTPFLSHQVPSRHEGGRCRFAAQGSGRFLGDFRLQVDSGTAQSALDEDSRRCAGGGDISVK